MWLLRRKTRTPETEKQIPPATLPMRRIEITVERHSLSRILRTTDGPDFTTAAPANDTTAQMPAALPPDPPHILALIPGPPLAHQPSLPSPRKERRP